MGVISRGDWGPKPFRQALAELDAARWRPELSVTDMPAPQRIAPYSAAITADVMKAGDEVGTGRLVLLHDPSGNTAWDGTFRCVTFARAEVDTEMSTDPLLASVGWTWLIDALVDHQAEYGEPGGTVTAVTSQSFGQLSDHPPRAEVEIRASWTPRLQPDGSGLEPHLQAWGDVVCHVAGLPPLLGGVVAMAPRRRGSAPAAP